jgi:hypothetical protein
VEEEEEEEEDDEEEEAVRGVRIATISEEIEV